MNDNELELIFHQQELPISLKIFRSSTLGCYISLYENLSTLEINSSIIPPCEVPAPYLIEFDRSNRTYQENDWIAQKYGLIEFEKYCKESQL